MGLPVNTVAAGGIAVVDVTLIPALTKMGAPVSEALPGKGVAVTKVVNFGLPVTFDTGSYSPLDPASVAGVTLSGDGLVVTNTGTTSPDQGARVAASGGKTTGKYYFEVTLTAFTGGSNVGVGVGTPASTYSGMGGGGTAGIQHFRTGSAYSNGSSVMGISGNYVTGQTMKAAVDLDNRRIWFYKDGLWNQNAANNPATNVGGLIIPAGTMVPFITFGGAGGVTGNVMTANFGASSFTGAVPSGFTSGWPT